MPLPIEDLFPDEDHRHRLTLRRGEVAAFFDPADSEVLAEREEVIQRTPDLSLGCTEAGVELVDEVWDMAAGWGRPVEAAGRAHGSALEKLAALGGSIEPDLLLLAESGAPSIRLEAGVICFPSSWTPHPKFGQELDFIHAVVPGLNQALEHPINTFFRRLEPGTAFERANWGLTATPDRNYHPFLSRPRLLEETPVEQIWLRIEDQIFLRMPRTRGIVFGIRLRIVPLRNVVSDGGLRDRFRRSLESLPEPLAAYKGLRAVRPSLLTALKRA